MSLGAISITHLMLTRYITTKKTNASEHLLAQNYLFNSGNTFGDLTSTTLYWISMCIPSARLSIQSSHQVTFS